MAYSANVGIVPSKQPEQRVRPGQLVRARSNLIANSASERGRLAVGSPLGTRLG